MCHFAMIKPYYQDDAVTIYHGDCHEILPTLDSVDLVLTDPPYGIAYQHRGRRNGTTMGFDGQHVTGDDQPFDPVPWLQFPRVILWGGNHYADQLPVSRGWLVWDKRVGIPPNDQSDCELAWTNFLTVARLYSRYWNGGAISEARFHPTQKPIALMRWCLGLVPDAQIVFDPFMGSGTTLRAAKDLGRKAIGIEIEERYCEIAADRMSQMVMALA
jgi:site-specific DNA-methyltransferase (adenine-specific)